VPARAEHPLRDHRSLAATPVGAGRTVGEQGAMPEPKGSTPPVAPAVAEDDDEPRPSPSPDLAASLSRHADDPGIKLVVGALRVRRDDPARAAELLADYRLRYPDGALAEEALVLAVEAAVNRNDPSAARLAAQYLERYPSGAWAREVRKALGRRLDSVRGGWMSRSRPHRKWGEEETCART
jgi:hypothetical protein